MIDFLLDMLPLLPAWQLKTIQRVSSIQGNTYTFILAKRKEYMSTTMYIVYKWLCKGPQTQWVKEFVMSQVATNEFRMKIVRYVKLSILGFWFLGVDAFHRKESGYPQRDFASRPDRAYKLEIQIIAYLFQDLQIGNPDNCLGDGGILQPVPS